MRRSSRSLAYFADCVIFQGKGYPAVVMENIKRTNKAKILNIYGHTVFVGMVNILNKTFS